MTENINTSKIKTLPLLALRGLTVFPYMTLYFDVGRDKSIKALEEAMINDQMIFLVAQKDAKTDSPKQDELYSVGTISKVKQILKLQGDTIRVLVEGLTRARIVNIIKTEPFFVAEVEENTVEGDFDKTEVEALRRSLSVIFDEYTKLTGKPSQDIALSINDIADVGQLADVIANNIPIKVEQKQEILEEVHPLRRMEKLMQIIVQETEILEIERDINTKVRKQIDKVQKEYYLREQMKAIQNELGDRDGITGEVEEYKKKIEESKLPEEVEKKALKELDRLLKLPQGSAEVGVIRTYVDWILDLPWSKATDDIIDVKHAEEVLEQDHYGLKKVKERIVEFLAVQKLKNNLKGPILCLVGPPGVGKTSIAKSIAKALNRNYVRLSLGGVKDESEIRGHRRTYVGSMPGRIISSLKQAGSNNPLILLDEIDKMSSDFRGDPASAMLEVLDSEQNFSFRDHYLELPFNLSNVLFLTTANTLETIPRPLLDRMEVINISSYTEEDKLNIAIRHLLPKQIEAHGLTGKNIKIDEQTVRDIISYYTREAGVRSLERELGSICRKVAKIIVSENKKSVTVSRNSLEKFLGVKRYRYDLANEKDEIGIATGLAWTPVGGETLTIEVNLMDGSGKLELTGHLGDIMKESARAAMSYIRSRSDELGIDSEFYNKKDIHIHVPEGAIPKDGPSAGITLATAMVSALSQKPVNKIVAMTGEITLRGRVLPIGGLKEKVIAAHRAGIKIVIIPLENKKDIEEIPENVRKELKFISVSDMKEVLKNALK
jgi:ATP-dependent Lon protease